MRTTSLRIFAVLGAALGVRTHEAGRNPYTDFPLPAAVGTASVRMIDSFHVGFPPTLFFAPDAAVPTTPLVPLAGWAFLIEHAATKRRVLFDLGIRKDFDNLAPAAVQQFGGLAFAINADVPTQLVNGNVSLKSIDSVIWSHSHFDHTGDMTKMPDTTRLYVGPGTLSNALPAYPTNNASWNLESDFQGHNVTELTLDGPKIAGQKSHDFFGDGSLFLIDMPGHIVGHIVALVRVTAGDRHTAASYILLAGDTEHHVSLVRPTPSEQLPAALVSGLPADLRTAGAPLYEDPFMLSANASASIHNDAVAATTSLDKLRRFDGRSDVWVVLSHDASLRAFAGKPGGIALFPEALDAWRQKGWKDLTRFAFLQPSNDANVWVNATVSATSTTLAS